MTEELSGRRIVVPETRELGQLVRMLEERGAQAIPCPMIAIRDAPAVRFGSLADILTSPHHVRFTPNNGLWAAHPSQHLAVGL